MLSDRPSGPLLIVHCTGSPVDQGWADLSRLYARGALEALSAMAPSKDGRWEHVVVDVSPDASWRIAPTVDALGTTEPLDRATALARFASMGADVGVPQMFCRPGLTDHRSLLELLGIRSVANPASVMGLTSDKVMTRAVVAAAGIDVPDAVVVRRGEPLPPVDRTVVVKPVDGDNSTGVHLVDDPADLASAVDDALTTSTSVLVEDFVPLGREVRCGTIERNGAVVALPLEEYAVDPVERPIRLVADKLAREDDGDLRLVAKTTDHAWIVADDDPAVESVQELATAAHEALGCGHHGLVDVRIDPDGRPWFLEAGPYCSFSPSSVVAVMAAAAGITLEELFGEAVDLATSRAPVVGGRPVS